MFRVKANGLKAHRINFCLHPATTPAIIETIVNTPNATPSPINKLPVSNESVAANGRGVSGKTEVEAVNNCK